MQKKSSLTGFLGAKGFTLIELLVVVLIIGILAAVAVPQYNKAVWRARNAQLKAVIKTIRQAQDSYFMANGQYAGNFNELAVDLPLEAPVQATGSSYVLEDICSLAIKGSDSIRRGKDFQVVLSSTDLTSSSGIGAVWTTGPYKCTGFTWNTSSQRLICLESRLKSTVSPGEFCEKIEKGFNGIVSSRWERYDLP